MTKRAKAETVVTDELVEKVQAALRALQEVSDELEEIGVDRRHEAYEHHALATEGMESLACALGFGVMNGILVP